MKHLKYFESGSFNETIKAREYDSPQERATPHKRRLTKEESDFMMNNMSNYAFSTIIDANGHIGLGGGMAREGEEPRFMRYITEYDLNDEMTSERRQKARPSF